MATNIKFSPLAPSPKLQVVQLKAIHFTDDGRDERVARGLRALEGPQPNFQLAPDVWKQIAEDPDLDEG
jgi:hypothetical protein